MKTFSAVVVVAGVAVLAAVLMPAAAFAQADIQPARFIDGSIPQMPPLAAGGGDVMLSVAVSASGSVGAVDVLRSTPPFTDVVTTAVRTWRFAPALDGKRKPMDTRVLIDVVIGAPSLNVPTAGAPPRDVSSSDTRVPFPAQVSAPSYPVNARSEGTALVEARVDPTGHVVAVTSLRSSPPFDVVAMDAARSWTFRPAQGADTPPSTYAYLVFAFRQPVMGAVAIRKP